MQNKRPSSQFLRDAKRALVILLLSMTGCGLAMSNDDRLDRAEAAIADLDYRSAIIDTKEVLRREPDNVRARLLLGRASLQVGDYAAAEKELRRAVELGTPEMDIILDLATSLVRQGRFESMLEEFAEDPDLGAAEQADWLLLRAEALLGVGQAVEAREVFGSVLDLDPDNVPAKLGVVASYLTEENQLQARSTLDEILGAHPESAMAWLASGELNLQLKRYGDAENDFGQALGLLTEDAQRPSRARGLAGMADAQFALGDTDAARQTVAELESVAPGSLAAEFFGARVAHLDKDFGKAQRQLQAVLQLAPGHRPAQLLLGVVHLQSGNLAQAEMYLATVVAQSPNDVEARTLLAETRVQMQRLEQAREALMPILSAHGQDPRVLSIAGRIGIQAGDIDEGISYLEQSVASSPGNGELKFQLAAAYISAGRTAEAQKLLNEIDSGSTVDDDIRRELLNTLALYRDGEVEQAIESAEVAVDRFPDRAELANLIGYLYLTQRNLEKAREYLTRGARQAGGSAVSQRFLAVVDVAEGRYEAAKERYLEIIESEPGSTWAMIAVARIVSQDGDWDAGAEWLERARKADPRLLDARVALARLNILRGEMREAEQVAREAVSIEATSAMAQNVLGLALLNQRKFEEAETRFRNALGYEQDIPEYYRNLATAQVASDKRSAAAATLEAAWTRGVADTQSVGMRIALQIADGKLEEAMSTAREFRRLNPDSPQAAAFEGEAYLAAGDTASALEAYDQALAMEPNRNIALRAHRILQRSGSDEYLRPLEEYLDARPLDGVARMALAQAQQRAGEIAQAISGYEKVVEVEPENAVALNNLAWLYDESDDPRAVATARKAYELSPDEPSIADTLGWILINSGEASEGVRILRHAVEKGGGRAEHRYHLAAGLVKLGEREEARRTLEEILRADQPFASRPEAESLLNSL